MESNIFEKNILNAKSKLSEIIDFVKDNANNLEAHQMEKELFKRIKDVGLNLMQGYFSAVEKNDVGCSVKTTEGVELKRHGQKTKDYLSIFGELKVNRFIYWKKGEPVVVPLDNECNLPKVKYSYFVQDMLNSLSVHLPFKESKAYFTRFFDLQVHSRQIEELTNFVAEDYDDYYQHKAIPEADSEGEIQVLSFDGKGVPMIKKEAAKIKSRLGKGEKKQKKKEALVGVSYSIDKNYREAEVIAGNLVFPDKEHNKSETERSSAQNIRRMASLKRCKTSVIEELLQDSIKRNPAEKRPTVILIDGMPYLQKQIDKQIGKRRDYCIILDIIHLTEYIWLAGNTLYGENTKECKDFVFKQLKKILAGKAGRVIGGLKQICTKRKLKGSKLKSLTKVIKYLSNHRSIMKYDQYLARGYPIGTGAVESACKQLVKQRMEGSGMRWGLDGAENMLLMRSIKTSNDWEKFHTFYTQKQKLKLHKEYSTIKNIA